MRLHPGETEVERQAFGKQYGASLWASGAMDNASDYGSEDSRFDSWLARPFSEIQHLQMTS